MQKEKRPNSWICGPIPVERVMAVGRSPGPDQLVRIPNGANVIGYQRHRIVRRVDRVDVRNDLRR